MHLNGMTELGFSLVLPYTVFREIRCHLWFSLPFFLVQHTAYAQCCVQAVFPRRQLSVKIL